MKSVDLFTGFTAGQDLRIGSLFSGIGGLELGLEWAGLGHTVWQVECEPFCRAVLEKHWPKAERFDDVRTVGKSNLAPVDLICGGFPCQDISTAGKGAGLAGARSGLWREFARILGELQPRWVVVENVAGGARKWVDAIVLELERLGYACLPLPISASDVGAPHRRARIFVVAHLDGSGQLQPQGREREQRGRAQDSATSDTDRDPIRVEQGRGIRAERCGSPEPGDASETRDAPNAHSERSRSVTLRIRGKRARRPESGGDSAQTADTNHDHSRREGPGPGVEVERGPRSPRHPGWALESELVPLVHGLSGGLAGRRRRARIRALGNTVVPQQAEVVGWVIRELIEGRAA